MVHKGNTLTLWLQLVQTLDNNDLDELAFLWGKICFHYEMKKGFFPAYVWSETTPETL